MAFAVPRELIRDGTGRTYRGAAAGKVDRLNGIFVLHGERLLLTRVPGTEDVNRLVFPEFVMHGGIAFLLAPEGADDVSRFRYLACPGS